MRDSRAVTHTGGRSGDPRSAGMSDQENPSGTARTSVHGTPGPRALRAFGAPTSRFRTPSPSTSRATRSGIKHAVFYEVLVRGFHDSNGDGTGDLRGLISRLDYLAVARHRLHLAAADLRLAAARRRLRHRRLHGDPARLRHHRRLRGTGRGGAQARHPRHRRPGDEPHQRPAPVVPGLTVGPGRPVRRLLHVVGHRRQVPGRADHLRRHRAVQLDLRPGARPVLLAQVLLPPA